MNKQKLIIEQAGQKLALLSPLDKIAVPQNGWINYIRTALNMSLRQLGKRLGIAPQSAREIEQREITGTVTLRSLREVADALDLKFVYGFLPKEGTIETMIDNKINELAKEIVLRTSNTMRLEDQENSEERIQKAIRIKAEELKNKMPKYLWD